MTDACPLAAGGYVRGDWFYFNFAVDNPAWSQLHINHKETSAIVLTAKRWAAHWANHRVIIHNDNQEAVHIINKGTTANGAIRVTRTLLAFSASYRSYQGSVYSRSLQHGGRCGF